MPPDVFYTAQHQSQPLFLSPALRNSGTSCINMADLQKPQSISTIPIPLSTPPQSSATVIPSLKRESRMTGDELAKAPGLTALDASSSSSTQNGNKRSEVQESNSAGQ
ncbi:uncharacterized protein PV09_09756 [Verruconis gallopava]|uniref:Uncharacterized protein n=1 Tax=Verruconis gallopava TaxID=253628 RepID=A0A0D1ZWM4_9PEZI|nr:uncharacterized protein PV09_09756 [Verruconis gallopava]KIV98424.1 hypothetical protein PV09_09756 [Verruconis gallopava]